MRNMNLNFFQGVFSCLNNSLNFFSYVLASGHFRRQFFLLLRLKADEEKEKKEVTKMSQPQMKETTHLWIISTDNIESLLTLGDLTNGICDVVAWKYNACQLFVGEVWKWTGMYSSMDISVYSWKASYPESIFIRILTERMNVYWNRLLLSIFILSKSFIFWRHHRV